MQKANKFLSKLFSVCLLFVMLMGLFATLPVVYATTVTSSNEERGLLFVSTVLPFDMSKYTIETTMFTESPVSQFNRHYAESFDYTLKAGEESTIIINVRFSDNVLSACLVRSSTGPIFIDVSNTPKSFLERYQIFTGEDLSDMLNAIDQTDNRSGNITFQASVYTVASRVITAFRWAVAINGVEYCSLTLDYNNGDFYQLFDNRGIIKIGNTDVNISQEQAVELALQYKQAYSYKALTGSRDNPQTVDVYVADFNVSMERINCKLISHPDELSLAGPCWSVELPLEGTNTGLWALLVYVNAVSGDIVKCQPLILAVVGDFSIVSASTDVSSSSTKADIKPSSMTYSDAVKSLNLSDSDKLSTEYISDGTQSFESIVDVSFDFGMLALIVAGLMTIISIIVVVTLVAKKRNK